MTTLASPLPPHPLSAQDLAQALQCHRSGAEVGDFRSQFCCAGMLEPPHEGLRAIGERMRVRAEAAARGA